VQCCSYANGYSLSSGFNRRGFKQHEGTASLCEGATVTFPTKVLTVPPPRRRQVLKEFLRRRWSVEALPPSSSAWSLVARVLGAPLIFVEAPATLRNTTRGCLRAAAAGASPRQSTVWNFIIYIDFLITIHKFNMSLKISILFLVTITQFFIKRC